MLALPVTEVVIVPKEKITLGREESLTADDVLNLHGMNWSVKFHSDESEGNFGMKRWKTPQARNLNFGKGSSKREKEPHGASRKA